MCLAHLLFTPHRARRQLFEPIHIAAYRRLHGLQHFESRASRGAQAKRGGAASHVRLFSRHRQAQLGAERAKQHSERGTMCGLGQRVFERC